MNTEINFLEKQQKQTRLPVFLLAIFLILIAIVITLLFVQRQSLNSAIQTEKSTLSNLQVEVAEQQEANGSARQLESTRDALTAIEQNAVPTVSLYENALNTLGDPKQLTSITYSGGEDFQVEAAFASLEAVSDYLDKLLQEPYMLDAELTDVSRDGDGYTALLTLSIDSGILREELSPDAE
ncbi:hypothetical protein JNUCC1_00629 [Lentibacillus sp. JNUCC-1]|uniref:PilN domain-containing protein n=1 Tax=Lentibacillus sp. JNUCC-1 TaxID=2654513 RepID=UPI0012E73A16|nr:hypothetical protein [Lentibacillus sp. JNUCC-1]MUV36825.1 hypothetical protein [Lentibacillus sp. JNUCC-1]